MKIKCTHLALMALFIIAAFQMTGCTNNKSTSTGTLPSDNIPIPIGVFESATGFNDSTGSEVIKGIKLAQSLYPSALNRNIKLIFEDAKSDDVFTVEAVKKLVEKDQVVALIGSTSSTNSLAAAPYIIQYQIPAVGAVCTNPMVTNGNPYYVRVCFVDTYQGSAMAKYLYQKMKIRRVAVIYDRTNDYAIGLGNYFIKTFDSLAGSSKGSIIQAIYTRGDKDFTAQLASIKNANVDAIFAPGGDIESAYMIQQAREMGFTVPIAGGDSWESDTFLKTGGSSLEGVLLSTMFTAEKPITNVSKQFIEAYEKKYGQPPSSQAALGHDAYLAIIRAIERSGSAEPNAINQALRKMKDFEGATGILSFDENGNAINKVILKKVKNGKFVYVDTLEH